MPEYFLMWRRLEIKINQPPNLLILIELRIHEDGYIKSLHTDKPLHTMQML